MESSIGTVLAEWPRLLLVSLGAFVLAEGWRRLALRRGVLDIPGHRSSHIIATPRGAGVGMAIAAGLAILAWAPPGAERIAVLVGGLLVALVGLVDDFRPLDASWKFVGQGLAALPVALALPFSPDALPFVVPGPVAVVASLSVILLFVNAWNFMDGIDGIATVAAAAVCVSLLATLSGPEAGLAWVVASALFAACIGFLPLNFPKARAFMGDCGSHALGFGLAVLLLSAPRIDAALVGWVASAAFLVDVLGTLVLRALDRERLASAHRRHLYQLVTRSGYSHARVTMMYAAWMLASGGGMAMAESAGMGTLAALVIISATVMAWWVLVRHFTRVLKERGQW